MSVSIRQLRQNRMHWVLTAPGQCSQLHEYYTDESFRDRPHSTFTSTDGAIPAIRRHPSILFTPMGFAGDNLLLPSNLEEVLDSFLRLPPQQQDRFLRACYWCQHANQVCHATLSGSFMSLISEFEALFEEHNNTRCPECDQPIYRLRSSFDAHM